MRHCTAGALCEAGAVDLTPTVAQEGFRADVRAWLVANLPWEYGKGLPPRFEDLSDEVAFVRSWQASLAEGGWVGVAWPTEYGGRGAGAAEHFIVQEELARARAPEMVGRIGLNLAAPTLLAHGTEEQKARWLSRIRTAEDLWCQLFSEPGAGSDLAGLSTRAARTDGGWLVNGQKVWTSYAQFADWGVCLAAHRPRGSQAQGHLVPGRRHAPPRRRGPSPGAADRRGRVQRGLPLRRVRARGPADRPRARGLAGGQLHPLPRAGHQPPPAGDPHPAARGAAPPGPGERRLRRPAAAGGAGPGLRGDPAVPAAQPAQREPTVAGPGPGSRGQRPQAVLE